MILYRFADENFNGPSHWTLCRSDFNLFTYELVNEVVYAIRCPQRDPGLKGIAWNEVCAATEGQFTCSAYRALHNAASKAGMSEDEVGEVVLPAILWTFDAPETKVRVGSDQALMAIKEA